MVNQHEVKHSEKPYRDEMNLVEFPIGAIAERVPIDPKTGQEHTEIKIERTITEGGERKQQSWTMRGDPGYGGLPRGYDLDVFTAIMAEWSRCDFKVDLIPLGSVYQLLQATGRRSRGEDYDRIELAMRRWFGASVETRNAIYDPNKKRRESRFTFRFFSSLSMRNIHIGDAPAGAVRTTPEFYALLAKGYLKFTNIERYWRLPSTYSRRLFQYLDKHRLRAVREREGAFTIDGYLLARRLGTFEQTLCNYKPAKLRDIMKPHFAALVTDGYLESCDWLEEAGDRAPIRVRVIYTPDPEQGPVPLSPTELEAVNRIMETLDESRLRAHHTHLVQRLGPERALEILGQAMAQSKNPRTNPGRLFTWLCEQRLATLSH